VTERSVEFFAGPGELRRLCRGLDWAASPLGPVRSWPTVLRSTISLCLDSGFPMLINWGPDLVALYNDAFAPLIGGKHPEALGQSAKGTWPEAWQAIGARLDDVLLRGRTLRFVNERQLLERNGFPEECYFTFSHSPIRDADGSIVGVLTASSETTAQTLNERRMRAVRELGAISTAGTPSMAETCRAVLGVLARTRESIPFAVAFLTTPEGLVERVADYGLTADVPGPVIGDYWAEIADRVIRNAGPELVGGLRERFPGLIEPGPLGPLAPDQAWVLPLTVIGSADPVGAIALGVNPYRPLDAELRSFFTVLAGQIRTTLTDAVAYETERHRVQVLAELDQAKMAFFQNVSHELRTPLTLLLAPLQDLLERSESVPLGGAPDGDDRDSLLAAVRAAERLRLMVDALLDFSGAEAHRLAPDRRPSDLSGLTADVASMFRSTAERSGLRFDVDMPSEPVTATVDRAMWSTIVTNLLSNAVKYTERGGITVRLIAADGRAVLTVTDSGAGITAAEQPQVFDRFHRVSTDETADGAGIGLALVADLVHAHLGHIDLASTPGQGSTFTVTVPIDPVEPDIVAPLDHSSNASLGERQDAGDRPRALLVEDDADLRSYITRLLTKDGWHVNPVSDAETALAVLSDSTGPAMDLVLTDLMLPGYDGLRLVTELRRLDRTARLPLIVLTARGGAEAIALGMAAGADDYITKPFASQELLARLRANHALHQLREQAVEAADNRTAQIRGGLQSNRLIGTAIGILMTTHRLTTEQGFQLLVAASQHTNRKLRDLAAEVTSAGRLPFRPTLIDELLVGILATEQSPRSRRA
jgi:signal transduction histidine kinase/DNA-binding response OmpR family regulator